MSIGIITPFVIGMFFGGFIASMLYYKFPNFYSGVCALFDNLYKKQNKNKVKINIR